MKRSVGIIIVILILTLGVIIALAQEPAGAELRFVNQEPTYSITAFYDVLMDDVTDISVTFDAAVSGSAYANYIAEDHQLRISVASLEPINLWRPIGVAVASTSSDDAVTPALRLTYLKYNGVRSDSNMIPGTQFFLLISRCVTTLWVQYRLLLRHMTAKDVVLRQRSKH